MDTSNYKIGVDVGGTNMKAVLFNGKKVEEEFSLATPQDNLGHFFSILGAIVDPLLERAKQNKKRVDGIGLSIAGMHDLKKGRIVLSPNLKYLNNVEIITEVEKRIGLPTKFDNDANCFLRAEAKLGNGIKFNNIFGMTMGTGIGGAWWLNNKIYRGGHGSAGEVGHTIVRFSKGVTLEKFYQDLTDQDPLKWAEAAYNGDEKGEDIFEKVGEYLGYTCANIINLVDPEALIIGGGVSRSNELFFPALKKAAYSHIASPISQKVKILKGKFEDNGGAIGAALMFE